LPRVWSRRTWPGCTKRGWRGDACLVRLGYVPATALRYLLQPNMFVFWFSWTTPSAPGWSARSVCQWKTSCTIASPTSSGARSLSPPRLAALENARHSRELHHIRGDLTQLRDDVKRMRRVVERQPGISEFWS
jgi:hypothetical protein